MLAQAAALEAGAAGGSGGLAAAARGASETALATESAAQYASELCALLRCVPFLAGALAWCPRGRR
jgi:hypothetical protein